MQLILARPPSDARITFSKLCLFVTFLFLPAIHAEEKEPPPPVEVSISASAEYPTVPVHFNGVDIAPDGRSLKRVKWTWQEPLLPAPANPLTIEIKATAHGAKRNIEVAGKVTDYDGRQIVSSQPAIAIGPEQTGSIRISIQPTEKSQGPFFYRGRWQETGGKAKGTIESAFGYPNARLVMEDFEQFRHARPGGTVENSSAARHSGRQGLIVRPANKAKWVLKEKEGDKEPQPAVNHVLPFNLAAPGRPVRFGIWAKSAADAELSFNFRDPGTEYRQGIQFDRWKIGPLKLEAGSWQHIQFPSPGYGRPKAKAKTSGEANGVVDYPLTFESIEVVCGEGQSVMLDDLEVFTQIEKAKAIRMRLVIEKPTGLLYRNDAVRLALSNGWLWGKPETFSYSASMTDISGKVIPLSRGSAAPGPGSEELVESSFKNMPLGSYRFLAEMKTGETVAARLEPPHPLVVYEPESKPLAHSQLHEILTNRHRLINDLGFRKDVLIFPWHETDGSVSVEQIQGHFTYDWLDPYVEKRISAGLEVVGRLGFSPQWADPEVGYHTFVNVWTGNTNVMPSRSIYWEEYVLRTLAHYRGKVRDWIIWDRPDAPNFAESPDEFVERMIEVAHMAAQDANKKARFISGGVTRENITSFLLGLIEGGADRYLHAVGLLPTTAPLSPEDGYMDVILARANRLRKREDFKPGLWALNLGYPTGDAEGRISENDQARYIARAYAICLANGVERVILEPHRILIRHNGLHPSAARNSAGLVYQDGSFYGIKPAAIAARTVRSFLLDAAFESEVFLADRWDGLTRACLFRRRDKKLVLAAWRRHGHSRLTLPVMPESVQDAFGNPVIVNRSKPEVTLHGAPHYFIFSNTDSSALARQLERTPLEYDDAPESEWKRRWTFFLDVGDEVDEKRAAYKATKGRTVGPIDSYYHNDYGRHMVDAGRHYRGEERFQVDVSGYGEADLILRKRINYSLSNQRVKVFCNEKFVGQWFAFKRDRRFKWRNIEYVIPNRFIAGKKTVELRFEAQGQSEATSYAYWAGPLKHKTVYASDLSLLVNSSGYGAGLNQDRNILGGPLRFFKGKKTFDKGLGTNAGATFEQSLVVLGLNRQFKRFRATVGIDAAANGRGSVRFRIGNGQRLLFDSKDMNFYSEPTEIDIDVSDAIMLMLVTEDSGDGNKNDIANWADARLDLKD